MRCGILMTLIRLKILLLFEDLMVFSYLRSEDLRYSPVSVRRP